ncbi:LptF/LptG family permease [Candidatus Pelagibacter giovannonii]|uniref:LptF/LptG family permease n=1 Tax=Candidatus Pelagibacter giovannonii TaxID=2563896 RepID=A0A6H1Q2Q4_9PROT|nr:LptF/LptG family permease [Candidatus Pelagibacter giovannonii]QIZ20653.1 LptF/LptG family permease [Candidatus Pelagibacter giovannonii]
MKKIVYKKISKDCVNFFLLAVFTLGIIIWVLQAVNYLDFVIEDGHGFLVYFKYTLLSFPKIISRIFPFAIFLAFSYILLKYENKNELVIFWNFGIKKINFINFFIKFSLWFVLISLLLNAIITPYAQDKARSFIRSSNLDFFESILKPKKFIDVIGSLTIYFEKKNINGELINIFLNEKIDINNSQTTFAKTATIKTEDNTKTLILYDGRSINNINGKISEFKFSKTDYNISKFGSNTIMHQKIQETPTIDLIKCSLFFKKSSINFKDIEIGNIKNCRLENLENVYKELYSRLVKPLYVTFLISISLLFILKSKSDHSFNINKFKIYLFAFLFIIFLESSSKLISTNLLQNLFFSIFPLILTLIIYLYFLFKLKINKI